jgi:hypothetical protein
MQRISRNLVAKHARKFNKATVMSDKKKKNKRGYIKHRRDKFTK